MTGAGGNGSRPVDGVSPAGRGSLPPASASRWPWWIALLAGPVAALAARLLDTSWIEEHYSQNFGLEIAASIGWVTGHSSVSFAQVGGLALAVGVLVYFARSRGSFASPLRWLAHCLLAAGALGSVGYAVFVGVWGLNYRREPIAKRFDLPVQPSTPDEVRLLALSFFAEMEEARAAAPAYRGVATLYDFARPDPNAATRQGREGLGVPSNAEGWHHTEWMRRQMALGRATFAFMDAGQTNPFLRGKFASPKPIIGSIFASYAGLGGIYIPFTAEPHVNNDVPEFVLPFNACHEIAHQRGVAREDEANYVGFRVARDYGDPDFVYSAYFGIDGHVVNALQKVDPDLAHRLWTGRSAALKADSAAYRKWHDTRQSRLRGVSDAVNSAYLKSNGIKDGVQSYGRVVDLLLAEQREAGTPDGEPARSGRSTGVMLAEPAQPGER